MRSLIIRIMIISFACFFSIFGETKALQSKIIPRPIKASDLSYRVVNAKVITAIFFGGFRGIIVDLLWIYIDELWHHGRFYRLPALYELVTVMQPEFIDGWVMGGWHMAYNMSLEVPNVKNLSPQLKRKIEHEWIMRGIEFLKSGIKLNPDSAKLYFEVGWTFYHRLKDYKSSVYWFEKSAAQKDALYITSRLSAFAMEKAGNVKDAYRKWVLLKEHNSYQHPVSRKVIDRNILRLEQIVMRK